MMSRHFALSSELSGAIAQRLPHDKNQLSAHGSFNNQFVTEVLSQALLVCIKFLKLKQS